MLMMFLFQIFNSAEEVKYINGQVVHFVVNAYNTLGTGFYCRNDEQPIGKACSDYEVGFCCTN